MRHPWSDSDLLRMAARHQGVDVETLMRRYYGSSGDARYEIEELERTGRLQESLAKALEVQLAGAGVSAE